MPRRQRVLDAEDYADILRWVIENLLTESQLSVVPPGHDDMLRNIMPGPSTTASQENAMPRRVICDFTEVPVGTLFYQEDNGVCLKINDMGRDNTICLWNEDGADPEDLSDRFAPFTFRDDEEVEYPPRPEFIAQAKSELEDLVQELFGHLGTLGMALSAMGSTMPGLEAFNRPSAENENRGG